MNLSSTPSEGSAVRALSNMTSSSKDQLEGSTSEPDQDNKQKKPEGKIRKPRFKRIEHKYPVEPRVIQVIKKPKTYMDHTYRDFSQVPPEIGYVHPTKIEDMTFAQKVFHMLSDEKISNWIHWLPHGRAFKIAVPKRLEQRRTIERYFGHNRYSSFLRQLNNHGLKHLTKGPDRNCYYHECMLRGMPHLTKYMPPGRDARRLIADPDNEPDFYAIERLFPLSDNSKLAMNNPLLGFGAQNQLNPLFGGLSNFQQLPPGLLGMATTPGQINLVQTINTDTSGINNFGNTVDPMGMSNTMAQQVVNVPTVQPQQQQPQPPQQQNVHDPNVIATLLQQQQQQQPQQMLQQQQQQQVSSQRAQSSLMRFM